MSTLATPEVVEVVVAITQEYWPNMRRPRPPFRPLWVDGPTEDIAYLSELLSLHCSRVTEAIQSKRVPERTLPLVQYYVDVLGQMQEESYTVQTGQGFPNPFLHFLAHEIFKNLLLYGVPKDDHDFLWGITAWSRFTSPRQLKKDDVPGQWYREANDKNPGDGPRLRLLIQGLPPLLANDYLNNSRAIKPPGGSTASLSSQP